MSKKPTITIRYPEASEKALKLTEAMVKRSPGKRVVETESEDPIFPDGGDLFSSFIRCKTQTGVDLTLTLNPSSMDFALETLIRPNLNADERKQILGESEDEEQAELGLGGGEASVSTSEVGPPTSTADETETQSFEEEIAKNRKETATLAIIFLLIDHVNNKGIRIKLSDFCSSFLHPAKNVHVNIGIVCLAYLAAITSDIEPTKDKPEDMVEKLLLIDWGKSTPDKVKQLYQMNADTNQDSDIEPGLLNDIDEDKSSTAAVRSAPLANKEGGKE